MSNHQLERSIDLFTRAVRRLADACEQKENGYVRDAAIQRFEFSYELAWKMLKRKLSVEGLEAATPREAVQQALSAGLLEDGNLWTEMHRMRNQTSHTYDESLAKEVYHFVCDHGLTALQQLSSKAKAWVCN